MTGLLVLLAIGGTTGPAVTALLMHRASHGALPPHDAPWPRVRAYAWTMVVLDAGWIAACFAGVLPR